MSSWLFFSLCLARSLHFYTLVQLVNFALLVILTLLFILVLLSANHSGPLGPSLVATSFRYRCDRQPVPPVSCPFCIPFSQFSQLLTSLHILHLVTSCDPSQAILCNIDIGVGVKFAPYIPTYRDFFVDNVYDTIITVQ